MGNSKQFKYKGLIIGHCNYCDNVTVYVSQGNEAHCHICKVCGNPVIYKTEPCGVNAVCECGKRVVAVTNCTKNVFEFKHTCGYILPVEYNRKRNIYYTMR